MKKLFTLMTAVLVSSMALAQVDETFVFTDLEGNVVPDGTTIVVKGINDDGYMSIPLKIRNNSEADHFGALWENIDAKPNGNWQTCAFGMCLNPTATGYSSKGMAKAGSTQDIETEWIPAQGSFATWEATLQLRVFETKQGMFGPQAGDEIAQGATVTIRFEYTESSNIAAVQHTAATPSQYYRLNGMRASSPQRGLNIVKRADGKAVKVVVR